MNESNTAGRLSLWSGALHRASQTSRNRGLPLSQLSKAGGLGVLRCGVFSKR